MANRGRVYVDEATLHRVMEVPITDSTTQKVRVHSRHKPELRKLVMECGLSFNSFPSLKLSDNTHASSAVERIENIDFTCRYLHKFGLLDGTIHLAYIPQDRLIGLSDFSKVINYFCQSPQEATDLTDTVFKSLQILLQTKDVMVSTEAVFFGVHPQSELSTSPANRSVALGGIFQSETHPFHHYKS